MGLAFNLFCSLCLLVLLLCAPCHSDYPYTRSRAAFYGTPMALALQVKCTIPSLCSQGAKVVVTDHGEGDRTDFILSPRAFAKLALPNKISELKKYGVVDIKYQNAQTREGSGTCRDDGVCCIHGAQTRTPHMRHHDDAMKPIHGGAAAAPLNIFE
ncbi:hypothetical protein Sjap_004589 [Stephania japonica]|uniref:Expansin-like EG45 domain-containing protein n=1 Tax=Stephania japonica TaxID=461633 RepID=A0AAP0PL21_9MAGN